MRRSPPRTSSSRLPGCSLLGCLVATLGCFGSAAPTLPEDVSAALVSHSMRRLETADMVLYYPEGRQAEAARFLERVEGCAAYEKSLARLHNSVADQKMLVLLPELAFNNAFVSPRLQGYGPMAVVPTFNTTDLFMLEGGLPPDPAIIGCHEITHYVHAQQLAGFAWFWNALSGNVYTPQIGLDSWFAEGLAVYYETKLQPGVGRLSWPFWHGAFAAGMAGHRVTGGDLSGFNRDFFAGNNYLVGSEFVSFLAGRYGEQKLWDLIGVQGRSILFPFGVNVRFWQAYDKSLSTLIDEFADDLAARDVPHERPPNQRVLRPAGRSARYGRAPDGTEALITEDHDAPSRLIIISPRGDVMVERNLIDVVPPRALSISSPRISGQPTFTADGKSVFFVALDRDATYQVSRLVRYDIATDTLTVVQRDLHGVGGVVSPDGGRYLFPRADGDHHDLTELDLRTGGYRPLVIEPPGAYLAAPAFSPDGKRVAATVFDGRRFSIAVFDAQSGGAIGVLPTGNAPVHQPSWADDHRLTYVATSATDSRFQVYLHDLDDHRTIKLTEAPFVSYEPRAAGGRTVRFLNREGWGWTLDEVALPPARVPPPGPAPELATSEVAAAAPSVPVPPPPPSDGDAAGGVASWRAAAAPVVDLPPPVSAGPPPPGVLATDRAASSLDGLFVPKLYGPTFTVVGRAATILGLVFSGNDRLMRHRWTVSGYYQFESELPSFQVGYSNRQLAPFTIELSASQFAFHDLPPAVEGEPAPTQLSLYRRERTAQFDVQRSFYGNPVQLGASFIESYRPGDLAVGPYERQRLAGPHVGASFTGSEATVYTGTRREFFASGYAAAYPGDWNTTSRGFTDLWGSVGGVVPVPGLRRHQLSLFGRARALAGLGDSQRLLQVGGTGAAILWQRTDRDENPAQTSSLPPMHLLEALRGFEDYPLAVNRIFIADATYRYPFIIDWGTASTLGVLPSFFLNQIDLRLFGSGATTGASGERHLALGGSLTAEVALWVVPLSFRYQLARRVTDDRAWVHLVTLGS